ncbi:GGDEF domain-containing protein [Klebsiella quasivariicola]|uniref:GGDEF domain-containing protein n=1 Tax=Klebsiella quasivariicola TaxID=2026240 RepID=UPI0024798AA6|nr:membrane-associated sensor domain-containing protein [Klebsiella quasivariicola]
MLTRTEGARKEILLTRSGCIWFLWLNIVYSLYLIMRYYLHEQPDMRSGQPMHFIALILIISTCILILAIILIQRGYMVKRGVLLCIVTLYGILWGLQIHTLYVSAESSEFIITMSLLLIFPAVIAFHLSPGLIAAFSTPVLLIVFFDVIVQDSGVKLFLLFSYVLALSAVLSARTVMIEWFRKAEESERKNTRLIKKLTRLADKDSLTGLANKRYLREYFYAHTAMFSLASSPVYIIMIDVDFFKKYNDHYGHLAGDQCLMQVAHSISESVRDKTDLVARFGGEEFTVLLLSSDERAVKSVCDRIQENLARTAIPHEYGGPSGLVTLSMGAAKFRPGQSFDELLAEADKRLYRAKNEGRNRAVITN